MAEPTRPSTNPADAKRDAAIAILDLITDQIASIRAQDTYEVSQFTSRTRDLAYAFRLVSGGPQPGSVELEK
ncbi:hypothetical protein [Plantibacter flavus]|uniref:hypothetical protein n=1 Tax=Plantibacter flavus TaxID=150123 RepID=UPI0033994556